MNVILSSLLDRKYSHFKICASTKEIRELGVSNVDTLILHKVEDIPEFYLCIELVQLHLDGVKKFLYISDTQSSTLQSVITGLHGQLFTDEFYFDSDDDLLELLSFVDEAHEDIAESSLAVVKDLVDNLQSKSTALSPIYIEQLNEAVSSLELQVYDTNIKLQNMGESSISLITSAESAIAQIKKTNDNLMNTISEIENRVSSSPRATMGRAYIFPDVSYVGNNRILYVREVSPCRYLTSFLMAYIKYLRTRKNVDAKLVILFTKGVDVLKKYENCVTITEETLQSQSALENLYNSEIVATNVPRRDVVQSLITGTKPNIIVLDRLYRGKPLLTSNSSGASQVRRLTAVSGKSDVSRFNLNLANTIFPVSGPKGCFLCIPHFKKIDVSSDDSTKYVCYNDNCKADFEKLDKFFLG